jgi:hypothetical protein
VISHRRAHVPRLQPHKSLPENESGERTDHAFLPE